MGKKIPRSDIRRKIILATNCEHTTRMQLGKGLCAQCYRKEYNVKQREKRAKNPLYQMATNGEQVSEYGKKESIRGIHRKIAELRDLSFSMPVRTTPF